MPKPLRAAAIRVAVVLSCSLLLAACAAEPPPIATRLVSVFAADHVQGGVSIEVPEPTVWRFDGTGTAGRTASMDETGSPDTSSAGDNGAGDGDAAESGNGEAGTVPAASGTQLYGWIALHGIEDLAVTDGVLRGRTAEYPFLAVERPGNMDEDDLVHAVEVRARVSGGEHLGVAFVADEELSADMLVAYARAGEKPSFQIELEEGDELTTYTLTSAHATFNPSFSLAEARHILLVPSDAADAEFEIESVRLITRREHLASIESGVGWQGLANIFRETIVARTPERIAMELQVPDDALLDLAVGTVDDAPVTFIVRAGDRELMRRTVSTPNRWEAAPVDLDGVGGGTVALTLALESREQGAIGFWGSPVVRQRHAAPMARASEARAELTAAGPPRGVILIIADTLRKDHLDAWGYGRETAPTVARMAAEGTRFADNISQGTWTKVSVPSILTSLYPSTHGLVDLPDRLPSMAVTVEEVFQEAGYATFHTSSVPFTGRLTNLHQGVEVLHEATSVDVEHSSSKTARTYVDRFLSWLDDHHEVPFFALVHVFDPHSPYRPYGPWDTHYSSAQENERYESWVEEAAEHIESDFMKSQGLPNAEELEAAGIDREAFIDHQHDWYDASIRAMDVEIARLLERLEMLGIGDDTLIAFIADHGEEFLEHGRPWHGLNAYGYMINTPMMLWWPGVVPAGLVIDETTQSIDLVPTLVDLAGLESPPIFQGRSMVPLLARPENPEAVGWEWRPAFAERKRIPSEEMPGPDIDSFAIVAGGWKLIYNVANLPEGWPEYELYDHVADPLNLNDVADANPEVVQQLAERLREVRVMAEAAQLNDEAFTEGMDPAQLERLRALGYIR